MHAHAPMAQNWCSQIVINCCSFLFICALDLIVKKTEVYTVFGASQMQTLSTNNIALKEQDFFLIKENVKHLAIIWIWHLPSAWLNYSHFQRLYHKGDSILTFEVDLQFFETSTYQFKIKLNVFVFIKYRFGVSFVKFSDQKKGAFSETSFFF
jgi:hypothetical protein